LPVAIDDEENLEFQEPPSTIQTVQRAFEWFFSLTVPIAFLAFAYAKYYRPQGEVYLASPEALNAAQSAQRLADGDGFKTSVVTPLSLLYSQDLANHPDLSQAPVCPMLFSTAFMALGASDRSAAAVTCAAWIMSMWLLVALVRKWKKPGLLPLSVGLAISSPQILCCALQGAPAAISAALFMLMVNLMADIVPRSIPGSLPGEVIQTRPQPQSHLFFFMALAASVCVLTSYSTFFLVVPLLACAMTFGNANRRQKAIAVAGFALPLVPWMIRNLIVGGSPTGPLSLLPLWSGISPWDRLIERTGLIPGGGIGGLLLRTWLLLPGKAFNAADAVIRGAALDIGPVPLILAAPYVTSSILRKGDSWRFHLAVVIAGLCFSCVSIFGAPPPGAFCALAPLAAMAAARQIVHWIESATEAVFATEGPDSDRWLIHEWKRPFIIWTTYALLILWNMWRCSIPGALTDGGEPPFQVVLRRSAPAPILLDQDKHEDPYEKIDGKLTFTDIPLQLAWVRETIAFRLPLVIGEFRHAISLADEEELRIGGILTLRQPEPDNLPAPAGFTNWLTPVREPFTPFMGMISRNIAGGEIVLKTADGPLLQDEEPVLCNSLNRTATVVITPAARIFKCLILIQTEARHGNLWPVIGSALWSFETWNLATSALDTLAEQSSSRRRTDISLKLNDAMLTIEPWSADRWARSCRMNCRLGYFAAGERAGRMTLWLNNGRSLDMDSYAACLAGMGLEKKAVAFMRRRLKGGAAIPESYDDYTLRMARTCGYIGLHAKAVELANECAILFPSSDSLLNQTAIIKAESFIELARSGEGNRAGSLKDAIAALEHVIAADPENTRAMRLLATCYERMGRWSDAAVILKKVAALDGKDEELLLLLEQMRDMNPGQSELLDLCERAEARNPGNPTALAHKARYLAETNLSMDEPIELAQRAVAAAPDDLFCCDALAWVLFKAGRYPEAAQTLAPYRDVLWKSPVISYHWGAIQFRLGNREEAARHLKLSVIAASPFDAWRSDARAMLCEYTADPTIP